MECGVASLTQPSYRNNIYATESLGKLVFAVNSDLPEEERSSLNFRAELLDTDDRPLAHSTSPGVPQELVHLPIPDLETGKYRLKISLDETSGETVHQIIETIHKLPQVPHEWRIDAEGVLRHNGKSVLPFGWFSIPPEEMADSTHAYNLMQWYSAQWQPLEGVRAFLDRAVAAGTAVTIYPYPGSEMLTPASWGIQLRRLRQEEPTRPQLHRIAQPDLSSCHLRCERFPLVHLRPDCQLPGPGNRHALALSRGGRFERRYSGSTEGAGYSG